MDKDQLRVELAKLLANFAQTMDRWENWLVETHSLYLQGNYRGLESSHSLGVNIVGQLRDAFALRTTFLQRIRQSGVQANDLRDVQRYVDPSREADLRITQMSQRLQGLRQHSLTLWILAFQCLEHTSQVLQVLSTGDAQEATYGSTEMDSIGGGRLVNQAA